MKKANSLLLIMLFLFSLCACGSQNAKEQSAEPMSKETEQIAESTAKETESIVQADTQQEDESVEIDSGKIKIILEENPTTGYVWYCDIKPEGILTVSEDDYQSDSNDSDPPRVGVGGIHYWMFEIVGDGEVTLEFVSRRSETSIGGMRRYVFDCKNGEATLISEE